MFRNLVSPALKQINKNEKHSPPLFLEKIFVHLMYWLGGIVLPILLGLMWKGYIKGIPLPALISVSAFLALLNFLFFLWSAWKRSTPPESWFANHLAWISITYTLVCIAIPMITMTFMVGILFVAVLPFLAPVIIFGPFFLGGFVLLWTIYRCIFGYISYLKEFPASKFYY